MTNTWYKQNYTTFLPFDGVAVCTPEQTNMYPALSGASKNSNKIQNKIEGVQK
jgi:hypothetical protein